LDPTQFPKTKILKTDKNWRDPNRALNEGRESKSVFDSRAKLVSPCPVHRDMLME